MQRDVIEQKSNVLKEFIDKLIEQESATNQEKKVLERFRDEIYKRREENNVLTKTLEALKYLLDKMSTDKIAEIEELVTLSLRTVFQRELSFVIEVTYPARGVNYDFIVRDKETGYEGPIMGGVGGSIAQAVGVLLRFIYIIKSKGIPKIILLDEAFGAIDTDYLPRLISVLKSLCAKFEFDMLVITHQGVVKEAADTLIHLRQVDGTTHYDLAATKGKLISLKEAAQDKYDETTREGVIKEAAGLMTVLRAKNI